MINKIETTKRRKFFGKSEIIDPNTGEAKQVTVWGEPEEFDKNWTKVFHAFTEALINDTDLSGKAIRLLFWITKQLEMESIEFYMNYEVVKEDLNIGEATYYRWKKILENKGIIKKVKPNIYMVNPACIVKGTGHRLLDEFKMQEVQEDKQ